MSIFEEIRDGCRQVAEKATRLRLDEARLADYARDFPVAEIGAATLDPATHYLGHGKDTLAFVLALDAINFGSGYFPHVRKRPGHSGYFTMAAGLNDWFQAEGAPSAARLAKLTQADCARIFGQDLGSPAAAELMGLFAKALNDLGALLLARFGGDAAALVESAGHRAEKLVAILRIMPFFDDVEIWHGRKVPFMKRAQLTAADLGLAFERDGWGRFDDLDQLTIFADNLVPHVLRVDGILDYDPDLAAHIDRGDPLEVGSVEEIEIRAAAVHAVELLKQRLHEAGHRHVTVDGPRLPAVEPRPGRALQGDPAPPRPRRVLLGAVDGSLLRRALSSAARQAREDREHEVARAAYEAALAVAVAPHEKALALDGLADTLFFVDDEEHRALELLDEAIATCLPQPDQDAPNDAATAYALAQLWYDKAIMLMMMNKDEDALAVFDESLRRFLERERRIMPASPIGTLSSVSLLLGLCARSRPCLMACGASMKRSPVATK